MNMKLYNKYIVASAWVLAIAMLGSGCKKYLNINQNPNFPTYAQGTPAVVFPVAVLATTGKVGGDLAILGGFWSEQITQAALSQQYTDADSYNVQNTDVFSQAPWDVMFT